MQKTSHERPAPPSGLSPKAQALWAQFVEELDYQPAELLLLEALVRATDRVVEARAEVQKFGITIEDERRSRKKNPALSVEAQAVATIEKLSRRLGLLDPPVEETKPKLAVPTRRRG